MAAKFTSAPGTEGGSRMPTISCPAQVVRKRRARKMALSSTPPHFMRGRRLSPMAKRKGWRCAVRISDDAACADGFLRCTIGLGLQILHGPANFERRGGGRHRLAEADGDRIGNRSAAVFQRKRPRSKLKMLPHTPSRFTGTMGASTPFMMRSMPRRNGSNWPMRVICPSAKMQTTSPERIALVASRSDCSISRGRSSEEIGIARIIFANGLT